MVVDDTFRRFGVNIDTSFFKCNVQSVSVLVDDERLASAVCFVIGFIV